MQAILDDYTDTRPVDTLGCEVNFEAWLISTPKEPRCTSFLLIVAYSLRDVYERTRRLQHRDPACVYISIVPGVHFHSRAISLRRVRGRKRRMRVLYPVGLEIGGSGLCNDVEIWFAGWSMGG